jgi:phosphopentomutase
MKNENKLLWRSFFFLFFWEVSVLERFSRIALIVLDSVGIGELPDAALYDDVGAHTLGNMARHRGGLKLPHLQRLGLGNIVSVEGVQPVDRPEAHFGKMAEISREKTPPPVTGN